MHDEVAISSNWLDFDHLETEVPSIGGTLVFIASLTEYGGPLRNVLFEEEIFVFLQRLLVFVIDFLVKSLLLVT